MTSEPGLEAGVVPVGPSPAPAAAGGTLAADVPSARGRWRGSAGSAATAVWAVLPAWLVARAVVVGTLVLARSVVGHVRPGNAAAVARAHEGLLGWDAGWYEAIARVGYGPLGHQSLRFFPLFPLAARALALAPGVSAGVAVVVLANAAALAGTVLLRLLVLRETGDRAWADRTVWLFSLAPPAFVLVMGYSEAFLLVASVACFLALRGRPADVPGGRTPPRWAWVAVLGFTAGLTRPLGAVLVLPAAVEALRQWRANGWGRRLASAAGVLGPVAGAGAFLAWSAAAFGNGLLPVQVQTQAKHHGAFSDPLAVLVHDAAGAFHHHVGTALHIPWVILAVILAVVCFRRLPASYGAFAAGVVLVALSGTNLDSFERYALSAFPLTIAAAALVARRPLVQVVLVLAALGLAAYAFLAFVNLLVP